MKKRILSLLLALVMVLSLAACASTAKTEEPAAASGKLTMATEATFPPYEYYDGDAIVGIDVEVAQAIAAKLERMMAGDIEADPVDAHACDYCPVLNCDKRCSK